MGTLSSPTKVKNIYQRLAFWTSGTRQVSLDAGKDQADVPLFRPQVDVSAYGITGNLASTDQAAFEAALTATAGTTLVIDCPVSITANTTIGATNRLQFVGNGALNVATGIKLTFTAGCEFNDVHHAIFNFAGVIKVAGPINHEFWRVEWFGYEREDNTANWAECINEFFDEIESSGSAAYPNVWRFRAGGTYYTTDPLEIKLRTGSRMNDLVLESSSASRWGGAILRQTDGNANVISGGTGSLVTRVAFRNLQFMGAGQYGADQNVPVTDVSIIDLLEVTNCGWFYCKRGLYARNGGAGAQIYTNCYFVNLTGASYSVYLIDMAMNAKFVACIMENGLITANGNITEPCSFVSCHIEACRITVPEARFDLRGGSGTTNGVTITLGQDTCHCHVEALGGGVYTYDHGHHNYVNGGYRYFECEGISSNVVQMALPSTRDAGRMILQAGVPYILSIGLSLDAETSGGSSYHPYLYDMATTPTIVPDFTTATALIDFGVIATTGNDTGYIPVAYRQEWHLLTPTTNAFVEPSHLMNLRATRPISSNPGMTNYSSDVFTDWQEIAAGTLTTVDGKTRFVHVSAGTAAAGYYQVVRCKPYRTYLAIMKITNSGDTLPALCVGGLPTAVQQVNSAEFIETETADVYLATILFRNTGDKPIVFSWGYSAAAHSADFLIHFAAIVEIGDGVRYESDGLPEVGVFYKNDEIVDTKPTTNTASRYYCKVESVGTYGDIDKGCALNKGAWSSGASYTQGECVSSVGVVYIARTTHTGVATAPASDTTNWKLIESPGADGIGVIDGNALFTTV